MRILVINGPNINMLGTREPDIYGKENYKALIKKIKAYAKEKKVKVSVYQSNYEGDIVTKIQKAKNKYTGIVINPGAYTHTSVAILDALKAVNIKTIEVHISNPEERENFRKLSYVSLFATRRVLGKGLDGYLEAIDEFIN